MHVLIIPTGIYPMPRAPLSCIFEQHQAEALRGAGIKLGVLSGGVITARYLGRPFPYLVHDLVNGVTVYRAHRRAYTPARWEPALTAAERTYRRLKPLLEEYIRDHGRPTIVHAHNLSSGGLVARRVAQDFAIPYVVTEHTGTYAKSVVAVRADVQTLMLAAESASAVIAVSARLAEHLRMGLPMLAPTAFHVVPNVVDAGLLGEPLAVRRARPFTILGLGNLIPGKNYEILIRAFQAASIPGDSLLQIGGTGSEADRLLALAKALGVVDRVEFLGHLTRQEVTSAMRGADLFAHPSDSESFGVVLIEAMALGVPLVATASGGPQEIVTPDVGLLTPVGDVEGFATGITELYRRRVDFDALRIRESCRIRFGPEAFTSKMLQVYALALT